MKTENKVLACVDHSHFTDHVADYAIWAAKRMGTPLKFLHVIAAHHEIGSGADHSGAIGINSHETLLTKLSEEDAAQAKAAHEKGRLALNRLYERALDAGVTAPDMKQRHGDFEETLVAQESGVDLFVWGRRGESSEGSPRKIGRNVERVVRALHKPILSVTEGFTEPTRVLFAFGGDALARKGIEWLVGSPLLHGLPIYLLISGKDGRADMKQIDWARTTLETAGFQVTFLLIPGDPLTIVAQTIQEQNIDLLIMGAYTHSPLRSMLFGCKTNTLLASVNIPVLLLR
ncbi:MAG: universal stress protein [Sideroxydans sp.]|jgi:nucleotide-binding universal stress UspA family protein